MLFRSFAPSDRQFKPGTTILSDEANIKGPKLTNLMSITVKQHGHGIAND